LKKLGIWAIAIAAAFFASSIATGTVAFADDDDDDDRKKDKTLESKCAKKLMKKNLNLDGLFCQAIIAIQDMLDMVKATVAIHETRITDLENQLIAEAQIIRRTNSMDFPRQGSGMFQVTCEDDEFMLTNGRIANFDPLPARIPAVGVQFDPVPNDPLGGNAGFFGPDNGIKVTVFSSNLFLTETTIELSIACVLNPQVINPDILNP